MLHAWYFHKCHPSWTKVSETLQDPKEQAAYIEAVEAFEAEKCAEYEKQLAKKSSGSTAVAKGKKRTAAGQSLSGGCLAYFMANVYLNLAGWSNTNTHPQNKQIINNMTIWPDLARAKTVTGP